MIRMVRNYILQILLLGRNVRLYGEWQSILWQIRLLIALQPFQEIE